MTARRNAQSPRKRSSNTKGATPPSVTSGSIKAWNPAEVETLLVWFSRVKRALPWRDAAATPYAVWVSEIMLQQTQVVKVVPYFQRFMARFPDVLALAAAEEADVLALWAGLGYYSRGRNLHRAARLAVARYNGLPPDAEGWGELPGIGQYTLGAVRSIAYREPRALVDGNVIRVLARRFYLPIRRGDKTGEAKVWDLARALFELDVARESPGDVNQALMELGATVCSVSKPQCLLCPLRSGCGAHAAGEPERYPLPKPPTKRASVNLHVAWIEHDGRVLQEQRGDKGLWAKTWALPSDVSFPALQSRVGATLHEEPDKVCERTLTHRDVVLRLHLVDGRAPTRLKPGFRWAGKQELQAMPQAFAALLA